MAKFREVEVKVFREHAHCDCGKGELVPDGTMRMTDPPQFPHRCTACGHVETFGERFPRIITRTVQ
ncbi:MAG TPA: hypothetical protein VIG97_11295 [Luteimonas sp.]